MNNISSINNNINFNGAMVVYGRSKDVSKLISNKLGKTTYLPTDNVGFDRVLISTKPLDEASLDFNSLGYTYREALNRNDESSYLNKLRKNISKILSKNGENEQVNGEYSVSDVLAAIANKKFDYKNFKIIEK